MRHNLIWLCGGPLIGLGMLLLLLLDPDHGEHLILGYLFGTTFGHATLAAAWTSFGPLPFLYRFPLSLLWLVSLVGVLACNIAWHGGPNEVPLIMAGCLAGQFLLLQLPFWGLALLGGMKLHYCPSQPLLPSRRELQFGIRQLMIFTAIVAVVLGAGRFAVLRLVQFPSLNGEGPIFVFLAAAAIVVTLPLLLAALLPRYAIPAVALVLLLTGLLTAWEVPLLRSFHGGPGPDTWHIVTINAFTAAWVLSIALVIRLSGYRWGPRTIAGFAVATTKAPFGK
jgi:hypothetical protein